MWAPALERDHVGGQRQPASRSPSASARESSDPPFRDARPAPDARAPRPREAASNSRPWSRVLPKPMPGPSQIALPAIPAPTARQVAVQEPRSRRRRRGSAGPAACGGVPCMCMRHTPAPGRRHPARHDGSPRSAVTSFTKTAPATRAARARQPSRCRSKRRRGPAASSSTTGSTRRSSSSARTGSRRPGGLAADVDQVGALGRHPPRMLDRGPGVDNAHRRRTSRA